MHQSFYQITDTGQAKNPVSPKKYPLRWGIFLILLTILLIGSTSPAMAEGGDAQPLELLQKAMDNGSVRVIVKLDTPTIGLTGTLGEIQRRAVLSAAQANVLARQSILGTTNARSFKHQPFMALEVNPAGLADLVKSSGVTAIEEDIPVPPSLSSSISLIGADTAWGSGYSGAGWAVAILDTGVDSDHPFLTGKVVSEACYSSTYVPYNSTSVCPGGATGVTGPGAGENCSTSVAGCDHGTHVAGIAAGDGASFSGVAKDADIIAVQVFSQFNDAGQCGGNAPCVMSYTSDQIAGLERVYELRDTYNIAAVNMSLGGGQYSASCDGSAIKAYIDALRSVGIATVIASGNNGYPNALSSPACVSSAVSVGSTTSYGAGTVDQVSNFSNSAYFLDLLAPGHYIYSAVPNGGYSYKAGTSMAAPHVAGAWAVLKSKSPGASVDDILTALTDNGTDITDTRNGYTHSRIQVDAAASALAGSTPTPTPTPSTTPSATPSATTTTTPAPTSMPTATATPTVPTGNIAPVLDNSGDPQLDPTFKDETDPPGSLVADIIASGANGDPITDPDPGAVEGLAVTAVDNTNGTWQFSTDDGNSWTDFTFSARLYGANTSPADLNGGNGMTINGIDEFDWAGWSVSGIGDVNADGFDDILIGANQGDLDNAGADNNEGEAYVIFGRSVGLGSELNLSDLDGGNGFTLNGVTGASFTGHSVSSAGDINGDGIDDFIIAAPQADPGNRDDAGQVYVVFGNDSGFSANLNLGTLNGSNGFVLNGITGIDPSEGGDYGDKAGYSVSNAGDFNDDGFDDIMIGAPFANLPDPSFPDETIYDAGQSYIIFGTNSGFPASLNLSDLNGTNGFAINGIDQSDYAGHSVSAAGDVNADGIDDVIIGAPHFVGTHTGEAYLVFGRDSGIGSSFNLSDINGTNGVILNGIDEWDSAGWAVSGAGDVNDDGFDDVIIGAPGAAPNDSFNAGEAYILFGKNTAFTTEIDLSGLDGSTGFTLNGVDPWDAAGNAVSNAGDINGDGIDDLLIGAPFADPNGKGTLDPDGKYRAGESYIVFGSDNGFDATLNLAGLNGGNGFAVNGIDHDDESGYAVSGAGDFNDDGFADFAIGAPKAGPGTDGEGETYLIFGPPQATTLTDTPNDRIRFVPNPGFTGEATITFRAWDTTDGSYSGQNNVYIGGTGGAYAFSTDVEQATVLVAPTPPELFVTQTIQPAGTLVVGQPVTLTLSVGNTGSADANGVVLTDIIPGPITGITLLSSDLTLTATGSADFSWQVEDLASAETGDLVITGVISPDLTADTAFTNTATIHSPAIEADTANNATSETRAVVVPRLSFAAATYSVGESDGTATITVTLNAAPVLTVTATISSTDGSAEDGNDYTGVSQTLTFAPGETEQTVNISILGDYLDEFSETILLTLSNPDKALFGDHETATLSIIDDDITINGLNAVNDGPTVLSNLTGLTATVATGNNVTFEWDFGDGTTDSGPNPTHSYGAIGSYTAIVTATNPTNFLTATTTVIVEEGIGGLIVDNDSPHLLGQSTAFTASVTDGSNITFTWNFGDGQSGSGANPTHSYGAIGTYTVTVTAANPADSQSAQTAVTITDVPLSGLSVGNNGPTTWQQPTTLTATVAAGSNPVYDWDFGDGATGSGPAPTHVYPALGVYTATVTVANGANQLSGQTVITVLDIPVSGLIVVNDSPAVQGITTGFTATIAAGSNVTYDWDFGDGQTGSGPTPAHLYGAVGIYTATVTVTNPRGSGSADTVVQIDPRTCWARLNDDPTDYFVVQDAIDDATAPTDVVKVAGTCIELNNGGGKSQIAYLDQTLTVRGGYTTTNWAVSETPTNTTVLDAQNAGRAILISTGATATVESITLSNGNAAGLGGTLSVGYDAGGAVYLSGGTAVFSNVHVLAGNAVYGGGMFITGSDFTLTNSTIEGNTAEKQGGGLYLLNTPAAVDFNTFTGNQGYHGGGLYLMSSNAEFNANNIANNISTRYGGGVYIHSSTAPQLNNTVVADNQAARSGSGLYLNNSTTHLRHSTIARNIGGDGDGLYVTAGTAALTNTIIAGHEIGVQVNSGSSALLWDTLWGSGSWANTADTTGSVTASGVDIHGDPAFVDANGGDYHILPAGAALDVGSDAGLTTDIDGGFRPSGGDFDLGADEVPSELSVIQLGTPNPVQPGSTVDYTVRVQNISGDHDIDITVIDTLPAQVSPNTQRVWNETIVAPNGDWEEQFSVTVDNEYVGPLTSLVRVTSSDAEVVTNALTIIVERMIDGLSVNNDSPTELGDPTAFNASVTVGSNVTYEWAFGDGTTATGATVNHTYAALGDYTVVVTAGNAAGYVTGSTVAQIIDKPVAGVAAFNDSPTTLNQLTILSATVSAGSNVVYTWAFGDGTSGAGQVISHTYPAVGGYTATVTAENTANSQAATTNVTITDIPVSGLTFTSTSPDPLTQPTGFNASVSAGTGIAYTWDFGDGQTGAGQAPTHTYGALGDYTVTLTATNGVGAWTTTGPVNIFNQPPVVDLLISPAAGTTDTLITADASGSSDPNGQSLLYTFNFGGETIIGPRSSPTATHTFAAEATHTVIVTATDGLLDASTSKPVLIANPSLQIDKTGPDTAVEGELVIYTLTVTNHNPLASTEDAILQVDPNRLTFYAVEGESNPAAQTFAVNNAGTGILSWIAFEGEDWLSIGTTGGVAPSTVNASVDISGLAAGSYTGQIVVDGGLAQDSPQIIDVTLNVFCEDRQPVDVMLALDRSGSMWGRPFADAQGAVKSFVDQMDLGADQVGLVSFNGTATVDHILTQNSTAVKSTVDTLLASGMTDIAEAINDAHDELTSSRRNSANQPVIILLSDGSQTVSGDPLAEADQAKADGIHIITIGMGYANTAVLQAIASSPADYFYAPTSADLEAIYRIIALAVGCVGADMSFTPSGGFDFTPAYWPYQLPDPLPANLQGTLTTMTNLVITDIIPDHANYVDGGTRNSGDVTWQIPALAPNTSVQVKFAVTATQTITNEDYWVEADGGYRADGTHPVITVITPRPVPALTLDMWPAATVITGAQTIEYTYEVENTGTITLNNIAVNDDTWVFIGGIDQLAPGDLLTLTKDATIVEDTSNTATAVGTSTYGPAMDTAGATVDFIPVLLCGATIQSVTDGDWKDANTWDPQRVPGSSDIVLVNSGHTVTVQAAAHTNIEALCNYGTLQSTEKQQLYIKTNTFLHNYRAIRSSDGRGGSDTITGHPGNNLKLEGSPITNWGTIQAGDGGDGARNGGIGGSVMVFGRNTYNYGTICAGAGGEILDSSGNQNHGGKGGDTSVWGNHGGPGMLLNTGLICAGDGGGSDDNSDDDQRGGDGGDIRLISEPDVMLSGGRYYAGEGGEGTGSGSDGRDGKDGRIFIEPSVISLAGPNTEVRGGDIIIFGGDDWVLDLSNMNGASISASGSITLAVGSGSSVDLRDNGTGSDVLQAGAGVFIAADTILLDGGTVLTEVAGDDVVTEGAKVLRDVSVNAPTLLSGDAGDTVSVSVTVMNSGPTADTYTLDWSSSAGISRPGALPSSTTLGGLESTTFDLSVTLPSAPTGVDNAIVTLTARSTGDSAVAQSQVIEFEVTGTAMDYPNKVFLPLVIK